MRWLVTGGTGFVGTRLLRRLVARGESVVALARHAPSEPVDGARHRAGDVADPDAVARAVELAAPERVVHLAALAHPGDCAAEPAAAERAQVEGTRVLLEALAGSTARVLAVSTAQVYGPVPPEPVPESAPCRPESVYGRTKLAAEDVARDAVVDGLACVIARPFNHAGPGQSPRYVLPAFREAILEARRSGAPVRTGNLHPRRDFLHVDDVLDAYELLLERGEPGQAYNVCRGEGTRIGDLLDGLMARLGGPLPHELDPDRVREGELGVVVGDPSRARALGWRPRVSLDQLLDDVAGDGR